MALPRPPDKHEPYPMSPLARGNWIGRGKPGCPECRKALTTAAQRSPRRKARRDQAAE